MLFSQTWCWLSVVGCVELHGRERNAGVQGLQSENHQMDGEDVPKQEDVGRNQSVPIDPSMKQMAAERETNTPMRDHLDRVLGCDRVVLTST